MSKDLKIIKQIEKKISIKLKQLEEIYIEPVDVGYVIDENQNIIQLVLSDYQISDISFLKDLKNLTYLYLDFNKISDISFLKDLKNLTNLDLSHNQISDISFLKDLKNLTWLRLKNNNISNISILKDLKNLTDLYLTDNKISDISFLKDLKNLTDLDLTNNKISDISFLKDLKNLTWLRLKNNNISDISFLKDLKNLIFLDLIDNQISDISFLKDLKNLISLSLQENLISIIPKEITQLKKLEYLYLFGNQFKQPPPEICEKGFYAIKEYYKSLEKEKLPLNEVKVLLVGDGGSGKTSLVKRLLFNKFDEHEPQTDGINITPWNVKFGDEKIKVNIWDFGGQEIVHATHQFFLSKRSLYILVLDGRKEEKTEYWLKHIESFGGDSPVLIVLNKIDQNPVFDVNRKFLLEKYHSIKGFYKISCKKDKNNGISNFSTSLTNELTNVKHRKYLFARTWFNVKNQLENMTDNFISYDKYKEMCEKENIIEKSAQNTLVDFLNDLGVILHFKDFELLDTHVLEQKWVTEAVYKIINSEKLVKCKGVLKLKLLDEILKKEKETDFYYPPEKYRYILDLMKKFELCYSMDDISVLIPDLLEIQEPKFDFDYAASLKFIIDYDFLPKSVMPRFIVKMHKDIKENLQWRTGVVLEDKAFHSTAVIKADERDRKIFIYVNGEQKRDYFSVILHNFREINNSFEKMKFIEKVPMPGEPDITVSYQHLIRMEKKGIETHYPDGSENVYNVKELLGTIEHKIYSELLNNLKNDFSKLSKLEPKKRGFEFEKFLNKLFEVFNLNPRGSFRLTGAQIDGSFQLENNTYLVEAKWQKEKIGQSDLLIFSGKVSGKAKWSRGLFISISGFSDDGLKAFLQGKPTNIIGMDYGDLQFILDRKITLQKAIELKVRRAAETNEFFVPLKELIT